MSSEDDKCLLSLGMNLFQHWGFQHYTFHDTCNESESGEQVSRNSYKFGPLRDMVRLVHR